MASRNKKGFLPLFFMPEHDGRPTMNAAQCRDTPSHAEADHPKPPLSDAPQPAESLPTVSRRNQAGRCDTFSSPPQADNGTRGTCDGHHSSATPHGGTRGGTPGQTVTGWRAKGMPHPCELGNARWPQQPTTAATRHRMRADGSGSASAWQAAGSSARHPRPSEGGTERGSCPPLTAPRWRHGAWASHRSSSR